MFCVVREKHYVKLTKIFFADIFKKRKKHHTAYYITASCNGVL